VALLEQNIQCLVVLIDRSPEPMYLAVDLYPDLVQIPFVAGLRSASTQLAGVCWAKL
jgi:hypothetical protein